MGEKKEMKTKKIENDLSNTKNEEELTYEQKSKHAAAKLKNILSHMKDFKAIIDEYRNVYKHAKGEKQDRY